MGIEVDKLIEFLEQYKGKGYKLEEIKQWCKHGDCNTIVFDEGTELVINKDPFQDNKLSMWVENKE